MHYSGLNWVQFLLVPDIHDIDSSYNLCYYMMVRYCPAHLLTTPFYIEAYLFLVKQIEVLKLTVL